MRTYVYNLISVVSLYLLFNINTVRTSIHTINFNHDVYCYKLLLLCWALIVKKKMYLKSMKWRLNIKVLIAFLYNSTLCDTIVFWWIDEMMRLLFGFWLCQFRIKVWFLMHLKKFFVRYYYSFHTILTFGAIKFICLLL